MIVEIVVEFSSTADGFGGLTFILDPSEDIVGMGAFKFVVTWMEAAIVFAVYSFVVSGFSRFFFRIAKNLSGPISKGWLKFRAIEWRL